MSEESRSIELEVEVPGSVEEVWRAIATGPGISSWYVPHEVEEKKGGAASASFGPGPEMTVPGRVAEWEPPNRVLFDGGEGVDGMTFEWVVEGRDGGTCIVRLVNTGFGTGEDWDAQYDGMTEGWGMFLANLKLHLEHFSGQTATAGLPLGSWSGPQDDAWRRLTESLGVPTAPDIGQRIEASATGLPTLAGEVVAVAPHRITILVDEPAPGTAFLAAEGRGDDIEVSIWTYLYGPEGAAATERDEPVWRSWLTEQR